MAEGGTEVKASGKKISRATVIPGVPDTQPRVVGQWGYYDGEPIFRIVAWWNDDRKRTTSVLERRWKDSMGGVSWQPVNGLDEAFDKLTEELYRGEITICLNIPQNDGVIKKE